MKYIYLKMTSEDVVVNNGERLYYQNLAQGFLRESKLEETKKNEEDNYTMEFNFKPRISKNENDKYANVSSRFYRESIPIQKYKEENEAKKSKETFTEEEINKMTKRLHDESKTFKENKEKISKEHIKDECTFTPMINVQGKADPKYFMMRLEKWNKKMEEKNKKHSTKDAKKLTIDLTTGQKLFQPKVDDPVEKKLKRGNENVHIDLYNKGLEHIDYRNKITKTDTREDLEQIESEKKEKIGKLKEGRERYKKEKQEKLEKDLQERSLKVKAEKVNIEKILKETAKGNNNDKKELDSKKKATKEPIRANSKNQKDKKNQSKEVKDKRAKKNNDIAIKEKEAAPKKNKDLKVTKKSNSVQKIITNKNEGKSKTKNKSKSKSKNKIIPLSSYNRINTDTSKIKANKENISVRSKIPFRKDKKDDKNERNKSQPQKKKETSVKKDNIIQNIKIDLKSKKVDSASKEKKISGNSVSKRIKSAKTDYKNIIGNRIGELVNNSLKQNKKISKNLKEGNENNVISLKSNSKQKVKNKKKI